MRILGILGSPRIKGNCSRLMNKALEGAAHAGAETKSIELIKHTIKYCRDCRNCWIKNPELTIGICPLKDDMHSILEEYLHSDGYVFASPVYDVCVTALMKTFLERKIALTYREPEKHATIPSSRCPAEFKKLATLIVTGNCSDEYKEVMGDPCFEALESHLIIEQIETADKLYVGGVEDISEEAFAEKLEIAYQNGIRLVERIKKAREES